MDTVTQGYCWQLFCFHILIAKHEELLQFSGTDFTDSYIYQQHVVIHHIDPGDGDQEDSKMLVFNSTLAQVIAGGDFSKFLTLQELSAVINIILKCT